MRSRLRRDLIAQHAEIFLINGDMNSNLYTSSRAMHSSILGLLQGEGSGMSKIGVGRLQNMTVSVQRRWNNVLSDATRQVCPSPLMLCSIEHLASDPGQIPCRPVRCSTQKHINNVGLLT